jgi:hypothetical protein
MEAVMRIRRTTLAPAILAIGTVGALVAAPALAATNSAAAATPDVMIYHTTVNSPAPDLMVYHSTVNSPAPDLMTYH